MELSDQSQSIKIRPLGGVNQRQSPVDLSQSDFAECKGLFPSQTGLLERIWGSKFLFKFDEAVLSISPTYNSQGHILIQTASQRFATTLDELYERNEYTPDLTATNAGEETTEEDSMSMAIVIGKKANSTPGKAIGTAYAARDLSDIVLNEGGIIVGGLGTDTFDIAAGTYRIEFWACAAGNVTGTTPTQFVTRMYNETDGANLYTVTGNVSVATTAFNVSTCTRAINQSENHMMHHIGQVTLTGTTTVSIQSKSGDNNAAVIEGKPSSLGEAEVYTIVKILQVPPP